MYKLRNWKAILRGLLYGNTVWLGDIAFTSRLYAKVIYANGKTKNLGLISRRVVTTAGVRFLCDDFNAGGTEISNMKFHAMGTGTNAEAASDTLLQTEVETRTSGSQASATSGANATYTTVGTITATAPRAITEHGIFSVITTNTITLWDRSVFAVINLAIGDSIQFTYTLTANSGG
jgi:hypothetical protein